jgi:hypothetical protein
MRSLGGSLSALVNRYGTRQKIRFAFPSDDAARREVDNVRYATVRKRRVL